MPSNVMKRPEVRSGIGRHDYRSRSKAYRKNRLTVPVYLQIIEQVTGGIAAGMLTAGEQLPTVRQLAVDLAINPNTVIRAYRELEIRGVLDTQQGTGTFIADREIRRDDAERDRQLRQIVDDFVA